MCSRCAATIDLLAIAFAPLLLGFVLLCGLNFITIVLLCLMLRDSFVEPQLLSSRVVCRYSIRE